MDKIVNDDLMKNLFFFVLVAFFLSLSSWGQTTWQLEETTLVEYDLVTGINIPWELLWGPDDMLWCTTRTGDVYRIDPATGAYTTVLEVNVFGGNNTEPGLLGMAMHPDWDNSPEVFLVYCTGSWNNGSERLSKFTWDGDNLVNEQVLHTVDAGGIHNGSRLLVLPDNTLLMTTGDAGDGGESSQNDNSDNGKVLRFNLDGSVPSNNPDPNSYVYSKGHRNSQGLCLGPNGLVYSSEHGQNNWDEFNIIEMGRNYGWPNVEGECNTLAEQTFCADNDVMEPLKTWSPCAAVNGIEYYNHPGIPEWQGSVLMAVLGGFALNDKRLSVLHMSEDGLSIESEDQFFSSFNQRVRDVAVHPETGAVYLAFNGPNYPGSGPNVIKEFRPMPTTLGCTEASACNFDPQATDDDGSCTTQCGCMDPSACNYDTSAEFDDGSCCECLEYEGPTTLFQTWKLSQEAGSVSVGPEPVSGEWYASPANGLVEFQADDRWTFTPDGGFYYDNNGGTQNPFEGYVETLMTVSPSTFDLEVNGGEYANSPYFTVNALLTESAELCGFMGTWDSGPDYNIVELTQDRLVLTARQQNGDCTSGQGWFTMTFVSVEPLGLPNVETTYCISGCQDELACNYNPWAEYDSGNCDFSCQGCTDQTAFNFSPLAIFDDGSCFYANCNSIGNAYWSDSLDVGLFVPSNTFLMQGVGVSSEWVASLPEVIQEPASSQLFSAFSFDFTVTGMPPGLELELDSAQLLAGEQLCLPVEGIPEQAGVYEVMLEGELVLSIFGSTFEIENFQTTTWVEVLPNPNPIPGCTYEGATNHVAYATVDNGSCQYAGCTDALALNYSGVFDVDDGSCIFGPLIDDACPTDVDGDGSVTTSDLLEILSTFGMTCN